ncbi:MAG: response regulator [Bacteroidales bacterium]
MHPDNSNPILILVAEDDEFSYLFLQTALEREGFSVIRARTGEEAVDIFKNNPGIRMVLMDFKMPGMGGYEATRQIRALNPDIPIIAQTAYALAGDKQKALDAGCNAYIAKPIRKEELMKTIQPFL